VAQQQGFNPGIQLDQRPHLVVIDQAPTREQADEKAKRLREWIPQAQVVQTGQGFLVVDGGGARTKTDALLEAIRLKKEFNLSPALIEVQPSRK
jgi:hypothetical protein